MRVPAGGLSGAAGSGTRAGGGSRGTVDAATSTSLTMGALRAVVDQKLAPFKTPTTEAERAERAKETPLATATRLVGGALALISTPVDLANTGFAMLTAPIAALFPAMPAATLFMPHLGTPHVHTHPPAMPVPLPSFGVVLLGGCYSVLICGIPAARAGDLGIAITCGSLAPPFEVFTGSSKVFIGGARAARMLDITKHCQPPAPAVPKPPSMLSKVASGVMTALPLALGAANAVVQLQKSDASEKESRDLASKSAGNAASAAAHGAAASAASAGAASAADQAQADALAQQAADHEAKAAEQAAQAAENASQAQSAAATSAGQALAATMAAAQLAADVVALAARLLMGKDPGAPPCFGALILGVPNVLIGGFPMPPWGTILGALGKLIKGLAGKIRNKGLADRLHAWINKNGKPGRLSNALHKLACFLTGHPIDVMSGRLLTDGIDFQLPGPLPLVFERNYSSTWGERDSVLGHGWSHTLDQAVWLENRQVVYRAEDGRELCFELPRGTDLEKPLERHDPANRLLLRGHGHGRFTIEDAGGRRHEFAVQPGETARERGLARLTQIVTPAGHRITCEYDRHARLEWVRDSAGRSLRFHHDKVGRLTRISLPHPDHEGLVPHVEYRHSPEGDLVEVVDALGHATRYAYDDHRLIRHTLRTGLSFYFEYDGPGADAACVHTWGDGGIYDHTLIYDKRRRMTVVTNSLRQTTVYKGGGRGEVIAVTDARGGVTRFEYDEQLRRTAEIDPLGFTTRLVHDERGNCTQVVAPDGGLMRISYDRRNLPVNAVDAVGGRWSWEYDEMRRLERRTDPLGGTTTYRHEDGFPVAVVDAVGRQLRMWHDAAGNLTRVAFPDGSAQTWVYDARGRLRETTDVRGNVERREYDLLGRLIAVVGPDGEAHHISHDAEGNATRIRSRAGEVVMTYTGMGRLASRTEAGTTVRFVHDSEERLLAIENEVGAVYRLERDPCGDVSAEYGFDGVRRLFTRDLAGRLAEVTRASGITTRYRLDPADRIVAVEHSDGSGDRFSYRSDGQLLAAVHHEPGQDEVVVGFERNLMGQVVRELQGEHWVAPSYDAAGHRTGLRSSLGADHWIGRDIMGRVSRVEAAGGAWAADFERELGGLEAGRRLPGGIRVGWRRDRMGRPLEHSVTVAARPRLDSSAPTAAAARLRQRSYTWDIDYRLRSVDDAMRGPIEYSHDERGYLVSARHGDGALDLRLPDALGNLFRREDRRDRRYGPAGQLLEAEGTSYEYDAEGNLIGKTLADGRVWQYRWNASGFLAEVVRPDGEVVGFCYDALGRRISKQFRGRRTRWIWDGNVVLHEWTVALGERDPAPVVASGEGDVRALPEEQARRTAHPALGPPEVLTWLFEPDTLTLLARLSTRERRGSSVVSDHLGTPVALFDDEGRQSWSAELDIHGRVRETTGERGRCPFRAPGQYEDEETGLRYNRFRYYDPQTDIFLSQDPIGLDAGLNLYATVPDPLVQFDPFGLYPHDYDALMEQARNTLDFSTARDGAVFWSGDNMKHAQRWAAANGKTTVEQTPGGAYLDRLNLFGMNGAPTNLTGQQAADIWNVASERFARGASGDVNVFQSGTSKKGQWGLRTWWRLEKPILTKENRNVTSIKRRRRNGEPCK